MSAVVDILLIEDSDADASLLERQLRRDDLKATIRRVDTLAGIQHAMRTVAFDVVLADHDVPSASFDDVLEAIRKIDADVPVIVVSGSIGEENAIALMNKGVADLVLKKNLSRLVPAILREIAAARVAIERRESEQRFRDIVEVCGDWIWETDEQHCYRYVYTQAPELHWADNALRVGRTRWDIAGANPESDEHWRGHLEDLNAHRRFRNFRYDLPGPDGEVRHVSASGVPVFDSRGVFRGYRGVTVDETSLVAARHRATQAEELLQDALDSLSEGVVIFDQQDNFILVNDAFRKMYADVADVAVPGRGYGEYVREAVKRGIYADAEGRENEWITNRLDQHRRASGSVLERLKDDRFVFITERQMKSGGIAGMQMDVTAVKQTEAERDYLANHDALTGLPNRRRFGDRLSKALLDLSGNDAVAVTSIEISSLSDIRDSLGLESGDAAIRTVAQRIVQLVGVGDTVSHIGGGQFLVARTIDGRHWSLRAAAEELLQSCSSPLQLDGIEVSLRIAAGISIAPYDSSDADTLVRNATTAMREAGQRATQRYQFYNPEMTKAAVQRSTIESELRAAAKSDQLFLVYQPLVETRSSRIQGVEALARWRHPTRGEVSPSEFIPVAEETGLIVPMGQHLLRLACQQAKAWQNAGLDIPISINFSAVQIDDTEVVAKVMDALQEFDLGPNAISIELTESAILSDKGAARRTMERLAERGVRFALDDFGVYQSSLSQLSGLPFSTLKIDRSFMERIMEDRGQAALVHAIISMAHAFGMRAIAEGVEQAEQMIFLQAYGCEMAQGFYFSKPLPAAELETKLRAGLMGGETPNRAAEPLRHDGRAA